AVFLLNSVLPATGLLLSDAANRKGYLLTHLTREYIIPTRWPMAGETKRNRIEHFERICRERRLPVTVQRRTIFEMILDREDHPTADQVYDQVRRRLPSISRTTVYRILDNLVELGLITKICHPGSAA